MSSLRKQARSAGLLYLVAGITAPFCLVYVPRALVVPGDAAATADRVRASETLLRLGIASELFVAIMFVFVLLALYRLFKGVDQPQAVAMVVLLMVSIPISLLNVLNEVAAQILARGADFLKPFDPQQRDALVLLFLRLHQRGLALATIFWGLWLFPFGLLVMRSGFIPRVLGVLLIVAGCGYLAGSLTALLLPQYARAVGPLALFLQLGEVPIAFWLLLRGAREQPLAAPAV